MAQPTPLSWISARSTGRSTTTIYAGPTPFPMATTWGRSSFPCQEGILSLPYDRVEREDYEIFTLEDACLCDATSMKVFLEDWDSFSGSCARLWRT